MTMTDQRTPETYRGIKVPEEIKNRATSIEYGMWKIAVGGLLDAVVPLLEPFEDSEPCSPDHHGYCQTHWFGGTTTCPVAEVSAFLDGARYQECVFVVEGVNGTKLHWCFQHQPRGIHVNRKNLVMIKDLPRIPGGRHCVQCGRELIDHG